MTQPNPEQFPALDPSLLNGALQAFTADLPPSVRFGPLGLAVGAEATEEDLTAIEDRLRGLGDSPQWWVGDLLNHFADTRGEAQAVAVAERMSYAVQTTRNVRSVCRLVPAYRRRYGLSFGHHQEVAPESPTDQEVWLGKAETEKLSQKALREAIRRGKQTIPSGEKQGPEDGRAAAASRALDEAASYYDAKIEDMEPDQRAAWNASVKPMVHRWLTECTAEEFAEVVLSRMTDCTDEAFAAIVAARKKAARR